MSESSDEIEVFEQYSLIRLTEWYRNFLRESCNNSHDLLRSDFFIYLGEIPNMKGHCVVAQHGGKGKIISGYHIEDFEVVPVDET